MAVSVKSINVHAEKLLMYPISHEAADIRNGCIKGKLAERKYIIALITVSKKKKRKKPYDGSNA